MSWIGVLIRINSTRSFLNLKNNFRSHKTHLMVRVSSFHKYTISNNKQNGLDEEVREEPDSDSERNEERAAIVDLKLKILDASLQFVPQHGWSKHSIALGAKSVGLSSAAHSLIEDGGADLVHYFNFVCNESLDLHLKKQHQQKNKINISNYIEYALEERLKMVIPFKDRWSEAMALMVSPPQVPSDLENLFHLVDIIWSNSGEDSLDGTWYSKRTLLAVSYKLCELSLVQDDSPECLNTFDFLKRRVETVMSANQLLNQISVSGQHLPNYGKGALTTLQNILGMNRWFR